MAESARGLTPDQILELPSSRWDQRIAADLNTEMEKHLAEKIDTVPAMRRFLAVKGYRELNHRIESEIEGTSGAEALRAMAFAMRSYALERPGMSAAAFRNSLTDSPEWRDAGEALARTALGVFAQNGVEGERAQHALRVLRSLVRGFVLHEMAASFLEPLSHEQSYALAVRIFIRGLPALEDEE
jgi:hypothetical protein